MKIKFYYYIILTIAGLLTIYQYFPTKNTDLKVIVSSVMFHLPFDRNDILVDVEEKQIKDIFMEYAFFSELVKYYLEEEAEKVEEGKLENPLNNHYSEKIDKLIGYVTRDLKSMFAKLQIRRTEPLKDLEYIQSFKVLKLRNDGNKPLKDVLINIESAQYFINFTDGAHKQIQRSKGGQIKIKEIAQNHTKTIYVWSNYNTTNKLKISHSEGIADIDFYVPVLNDFAKFIDQNYAFVLWLLFLPFFGYSARFLIEKYAKE